MIENLYFIPMIIALLICLYALGSLKARKKHIVMSRPFKSHLSNDLYVMSFEKPFVWFIDPNPESPKAKRMNQLLGQAGLMGVCDYRVFSVIQTSVMITCFTIGLLFVFFLEPMSNLVKFLFNIQIYTDGMNTQQTSLTILLIMLSISLIPTLFIKNQAKRNQYNFVKDLPVLQLFIIQMLQANNPVGKVLYLMSEIQTRYRDIFTVSYRIYSRNTTEGMNHLSSIFQETRFKESINVLKDYDNYAKKESIKIMNNISKDIEGDLKSLKKKKTVTSTIFTQGILFIPLLSIIFLGVLPIVVFATSMMSEAQNF